MTSQTPTPNTAKRASRFDPLLVSLLSRPAGAAPSPANELERLKRAHDWFEMARAKGRLEWSRSHPLSKETAPTWLGYEPASEDWDAMMQSIWHDAHGLTIAVLDPKPSRVLDLGCGVHAQWILEAAQAPGWEQTQFVGVDLAPSLVPLGMLPVEVRARVAFAQHNVLDPAGLPFFDDEFDFVRISCINSGIPEHAWDPLIEECRRVLKPGCKLEVLDTLFSLYMPRPIPAIVDACGRIVWARAISLNLHASIPPALAMNDLKGLRAVQLPVLQAPARVPTPSAGNRMEADEQQARILLHLWSQRIGSHALPIARAVEDSHAAQAVPGARTAKDSAAVEKELEGAVLEWTDELREIAGVASLMEREWGWGCAFDERLERGLATRVSVLERELTACEQERGQRGRGDPARVQELETASHHLEVQKRDVAQELELVKRRLWRAPLPRPSERESMGIFGGEAWVCNKGVERV